ncbi:TPA_asm: coat protein [ssRNA phage SRR7976299_15]|uniref:Coat protein n=1 Tax=ssRNA phage SRR7976299_15 TaxID=2786637 RepID=A0A8S5L5H2_9VIRU|nr:coat protein [ssRNA phage SRR7976299_15]DAD52653.1 TPA_asm: coat protein [ssRNA phage SRR7976299_15]
MAITVNTKSFKSFRLQADSNQLNGPGAVAGAKDEIILRRKFPVATPSFRGVSRPGVKHTRTLTTDLGAKVPMVIDVAGSVPVGASGSDVLVVLADAAAFLASTEAQELFTQLDINVA